MRHSSTARPLVSPATEQLNIISTASKQHKQPMTSSFIGWFHSLYYTCTCTCRIQSKTAHSLESSTRKPNTTACSLACRCWSLLSIGYTCTCTCPVVLGFLVELSNECVVFDCILHVHVHVYPIDNKLQHLHAKLHAVVLGFLVELSNECVVFDCILHVHVHVYPIDNKLQHLHAKLHAVVLGFLVELSNECAVFDCILHVHVHVYPIDNKLQHLHAKHSNKTS